MNATEVKTADNGRKLVPHDGITEWSVCGKCGESIDWANDVLTAGRDRNDTSCPYCGHKDTAYLYASSEPETVWVVRDASGEYVTHEDGSGRSPASNEAYEFETRAAAENACVRTTDEVCMRGKDDDE